MNTFIESPDDLPKQPDGIYQTIDNIQVDNDTREIIVYPRTHVVKRGRVLNSKREAPVVLAPGQETESAAVADAAKGVWTEEVIRRYHDRVIADINTELDRLKGQLHKLNEDRHAAEAQRAHLKERYEKLSAQGGSWLERALERYKKLVGRPVEPREEKLIRTGRQVDALDEKIRSIEQEAGDIRAKMSALTAQKVAKQEETDNAVAKWTG